jgi:hypothetical protein
MIRLLSVIALLLFFYSSIVVGQETHIWYSNDFQLNNNSTFVGKDSLVILNYPNSSKKAAGKLAFDNDGVLSPFKVGEWTYYYPNGSIQSRGNYQMSSFIDCGTGGLERVFYHYKIGKWSFFDADEDLIAEGDFKTKELPISTRCDSEIILFGISDSSWTISEPKKISRQEIETVEIGYETYSVKIFYDRKDEWIKVEYNLSQ